MLTTAGADRLIAVAKETGALWVNNQSFILSENCGRRLGINTRIKLPIIRPEPIALVVALITFSTS